MNSIRDFVRRYPLLSFFALAFGLSWLAWAPYILSAHGLNLDNEIHFPDGNNAQLAGIAPGAFLGPLTAALIVTSIASGREGLRHWRARLFRFRVAPRWYLAVILGTPAFVLLGTLALPAARADARVPEVGYIAAYLPMLLIQFFVTAMAEEPGWRDFALPRLQRKCGPVLGTVVLGLLWGAWHLPLFLTDWGGYKHITWGQPVVFIASCVLLSLVMTWVFNRTNQSLPLVMLLHAGINATYSSVWLEIFPHLDPDKDSLYGQLIATTVLSLILIVATRGKLGLRTEDNASRERTVELSAA